MNGVFNFSLESVLFVDCAGLYLLPNSGLPRNSNAPSFHLSFIR